MNKLLRIEYDNNIIFTNADKEYILEDDTYFTYNNFENLVNNIDSWEIILDLYYEKNMKNTKYPFLIIGDYIKLYLAGYTDSEKKLYQITISKEFLHQKNDSIIFVLGLNKIRYINGYLSIHFEREWNTDYINPNEKIIVNKENKQIMLYIAKITGNISVIKLSNFHVKNFELNKIYPMEQIDNKIKFSVNRIIVKKETNNLAFEYSYEEE